GWRERGSGRAALAVRAEVAPQRISGARRASAGSKYRTVVPVPSPTAMPSSTRSAAASDAACFSCSALTVHQSPRWADRDNMSDMHSSDHRSGLLPEDHVIVLFGATGDLAKRKLLPGLFHLAKSHLLPSGYRI